MTISTLTIGVGILTVILIAVYRYFVMHFNYYKKQGIDGPSPIPLFGTWWGAWNQQYHKNLLDLQQKYGKIYGTFDGRLPNTVIADPELMKKIFIKDFDHFTNRREFFPNNEYLHHNVGALRDEKWKEVRSGMSPAFSSGKIKHMVAPLTECAVSLVEYLEPIAKSSTPINLKEVISGFTLDVIASCVLGTKIKSLRDKNDPFVRTAMNILQGQLSPMGNMIFILCSIYPQLTKLIPAKAFAGIDFFAGVAKNIVADKKASPSSDRTDFLEMLLAETKDNSKNSPFKDNEALLLGQVVVFLLAGFDTPATAISTILHCLAMNQDVQDKLRAEIRSGMKKHGGITYEFNQDVPYMEQCIAESLRLYPTNSKTERECGKTITYGKVRIEKGTNVTLPMYAIHHDPEIYPNPSKFDPERFSPEQKAKRDPMNYIAFGGGPRNCMGMRFATEQMKIGLAHLISNYRFSPNALTNDPPKFLNGAFPLFGIVAPELWVSVEKIEM